MPESVQLIAPVGYDDVSHTSVLHPPNSVISTTSHESQLVASVFTELITEYFGPVVETPRISRRDVHGRLLWLDEPSGDDDFQDFHLRQSMYDFIESSAELTAAIVPVSAEAFPIQPKWKEEPQVDLWEGEDDQPLQPEGTAEVDEGTCNTTVLLFDSCEKSTKISSMDLMERKPSVKDPYAVDSYPLANDEKSVLGAVPILSAKESPSTAAPAVKAKPFRRDYGGSRSPVAPTSLTTNTSKSMQVFGERSLSRCLKQLNISPVSSDRSEYIQRLWRSGGVAVLDDEKRRVKQCLRSYDDDFSKLFGRMPGRLEKEPLRPVYVYYREIKAMIDNQPADTIEGGNCAVTSRKSVISTNDSMDTKVVVVDTRSQASRTYDVLKHEVYELEKRLQRLQDQKLFVRETLQNYQVKFKLEYKREIKYHKDITPIEADYRKYKQLKQEIEKTTHELYKKRKILEVSS